MKQCEVILSNSSGLHARPANALVKKAKSYHSQIWLETVKAKVDAKNIVKVLSLGVPQGTIVIITAKGDDEVEAVNGLAELIESKFGKE